MGLSFYIISHFLTGAIALFLGWSVFKKHPKRLVNRIFALSALSIAIWSISYSVWLMAGNPTSALFWARALNLGATLIPVFYLHWILVLLNKNKNKLIVFYYLLTAVFVLFSYSDYYISHTIPVLIFPYWPQMGWLYLVFIFSCWISIIIYCLVILVKELQRAEGNYRKQIKYVLIGSIIGFAGGSMNFPLMLGIDVLPPIGSPLIVVYTIIFSYSMVKHRLMDIRFVVRQGSVLVASLLTII
ncbi:MAG: hypothetical protein KAJ48_03230, partial [Elusimicrobiales bacterium]|nr:hypothetical protein [Elusimicrobiales bacterium]